MKTLSLIAFITGQFLIVCSCTEKNLEIKGKVLDENTKVAVPYREIIVQALVNNENKVIIPVDDVLYLSWESDGINGKFLYPYTIKNHGITSSNIELKWIGGNIKSEIKTKVFADKKTIVRWEIFSNGKSKKVTDTIFCKRDVSNYIKYKY